MQCSGQFVGEIRSCQVISYSCSKLSGVKSGHSGEAAVNEKGRQSVFVGGACSVSVSMKVKRGHVRSFLSRVSI